MEQRYITYEDLKQAAVESGRSYDMAMLDKAYALAEKAHNGQKRRSGEIRRMHPRERQRHRAQEAERPERDGSKPRDNELRGDQFPPAYRNAEERFQRIVRVLAIDDEAADERDRERHDIGKVCPN